MGALLGDIEGERDQRLLARFDAGDPLAFGELYDLYFARLVRFCSQRVRDAHIAEEVAQDTFVRAYEAVGRLRDGSRFYPWLTVIAHRILIDNYRRLGRLELVADVDGGIEPPADADLIMRAEAEALEAALNAALSRVRPRHREVLRLRETEGLSYEDIAIKIGVPATTVPSLLHRARSALRREYFAVTEQERIAGVPGLLVGGLLALRRMRDRMMQTVSGLPDMSGLATPLASVMLVVAGGFVLGDGPSGPATRLDESMHTNTLSSGILAPIGGNESGPGNAHVESPSQRTPRGSRLTPLGLVEHGSSYESARQNRERMRQMPIYYEFGDVAFSADPGAMQRDLISTTEGDLSWMEGSCNQDGDNC